jgi:hypothetical protein
MKSVIAKLGNMRKSTDWIVYPQSRTADRDATTLIIQSNSRICEFDAATGAGMLSAHRTSGAYFIHCSVPHPSRSRLRSSPPCWTHSPSPATASDRASPSREA